MANLPVLSIRGCEFAVRDTHTKTNRGSKETEAIPFAVSPCTAPVLSIVVTSDTPVANLPHTSLKSCWLGKLEPSHIFNYLVIQQNRKGTLMPLYTSKSWVSYGTHNHGF